jgi:diguanylate cyclase (GGDEF)-like protein
MRNRLTLRHALLGASAGSAAIVFPCFFLYEKPGLGIGHFYYVSIILAALATGPWIGASAGAAATGLYAVGVFVNPAIPPTEVLTTSTAIRFVTYMTVGAVTGYFAQSNRTLLAELRVLAERDALTGLPNTRAFERAITDRLERGDAFALLIGDLDGFVRVNESGGPLRGDDMLREVGDRLLRALRVGDEVARVGGDEFAVVAGCQGIDDAAKLAALLERVLADDGFAVTFGWAAFPQDGTNALSLYRAADERLYARKLIRGERRSNVTALGEQHSARRR